MIIFKITIIFQEGDQDENDEMMTPRVQEDWMLKCQYGAAYPQSDKDKDDHDWLLAGMAHPNLQELSSFITQQHLEYVPQPTATTGP